MNCFCMLAMVLSTHPLSLPPTRRTSLSWWPCAPVSNGLKEEMVSHNCTSCWRAPDPSREYPPHTPLPSLPTHSSTPSHTPLLVGSFIAPSPSSLFSPFSYLSFLPPSLPLSSTHPRHADLQQVKAVFKRMFTEPHAKVTDYTSPPSFHTYTLPLPLPPPTHTPPPLISLLSHLNLCSHFPTLSLLHSLPTSTSFPPPHPLLLHTLPRYTACFWTR